MKDLVTSYIQSFASKDISSLEDLFAENVCLRDWNGNATGKMAVLDFIREIFDQVNKIDIRVVDKLFSTNKAMCEIELVVDGESLFVVDSFTFNDMMKIVEIRAYKG